MLKRNVLDHGFVTLRNVAGPTRRPNSSFDASSVDPANSARMSFNQTDSKRTLHDELKLLKYLITNHHWTPVEMIEVWLEMKMPIFVARQFVRHRTACINEVSGRYVTLPAEWYIPEVVGGKPVGGAKQGQSDTLPLDIQEAFREELNDACQESYDRYIYWMHLGVAPEHARMRLHLNHYTHWLWKQDLRNVLGFLALRLDSHAQIEAQVYALEICDLLRLVLPDLMAIAIPENFDESKVDLSEFKE